MVLPNFSHQHFEGAAFYSEEDGCYFGHLLHMDDLVTYEAQSYKELYPAFLESVKDYIRTKRALIDADTAKRLLKGERYIAVTRTSINIRVLPHEPRNIPFYAISLARGIRDALLDTDVRRAYEVERIHCATLKPTRNRTGYPVGVRFSKVHNTVSCQWREWREDFTGKVTCYKRYHMRDYSHDEAVKLAEKHREKMIKLNRERYAEYISKKQ